MTQGPLSVAQSVNQPPPRDTSLLQSRGIHLLLEPDDARPFLLQETLIFLGGGSVEGVAYAQLLSERLCGFWEVVGGKVCDDGFVPARKLLSVVYHLDAGWTVANVQLFSLSAGQYLAHPVDRAAGCNQHNRLPAVGVVVVPYVVWMGSRSQS